MRCARAIDCHARRRKWVAVQVAVPEKYSSGSTRDEHSGAIRKVVGARGVDQGEAKRAPRYLRSSYLADTAYGFPSSSSSALRPLFFLFVLSMASFVETPAVGAPIDVHRLYGPILIGVFFNMILYGVLVTQITTYFQAQRKDALWIRLLVFYVFFIETSNTALDIAVMYQPLILEYGTIPGALPTVFLTQPLCIALVAFPIEVFFIWRIYSLTEARILPAIFFVLSLLAFGGGIWTTVALGGAGRWDNVSVSFHAASLWIAASMTTDLCIAFCLAWVLRKKKTGFGVTDTVVDRIIRMTVQTGLITAIVNILDLFSFLFVKNSTLNFMWSNPLSKLYSNCMMSTLNARSNLKDSLPDHIADSHSGPTRGNMGVDSVLVAAPRFPLHNKTAIGRSDSANDVSDGGYEIRMHKVVERF